MLAPHVGAAEPCQAAPKVPEAQNRPDDAGKPEGLAGCSPAQASAACGSCSLAVQAPAQPQATCVSQVCHSIALAERCHYGICFVRHSLLCHVCLEIGVGFSRPYYEHHVRCTLLCSLSHLGFENKAAATHLYTVNCLTESCLRALHAYYIQLNQNYILDSKVCHQTFLDQFVYVRVCVCVWLMCQTACSGRIHKPKRLIYKGMFVGGVQVA